MQAVMILRQSDPSWAEAKRQLGEANFIKQLVEFDKDNMSDKGRYTDFCTQLYYYVIDYWLGVIRLVTIGEPIT